MLKVIRLAGGRAVVMALVLGLMWLALPAQVWAAPVAGLGGGESESSSLTLILLIGLVVVIAGAGVGLVFSRRKK